MKKKYSLFLLLLFAVLACVAQPPKSSLLWEISGKGLQHPSYIFGTFHIMCKGDFTVGEVLTNKIKACGQFYGELKMDDPDLQTKMMQQMMMPGKSIESFMTDSEFTKISAAFLSITGMPMSLMNHFKPFLALSLLALKSTPCTETVQPETEMVAVASKNKIPVLGLETVDDQLDVISKEPLDSQIDELKKTVLNFDSVKISMQQLIREYKKHDIDSLYAFMKHSGLNPDFETNLLDNRNKKWILLIEKAIHLTPSFFAVGSGHLGGPEGVIHLLRKQGYTVTPVKF